ncbi:MAG: ATP-binding protein [Thermovirgaceae bacterium]|nr:ATP-binding protein [Thermovirgaceae bacterium]
MYVSLIQNAALLVALCTFYSLISRLRRDGEVWPRILAGLLFGGVAVAGMNMPFHYAPGIIYDGRSIVLSMAGLFGGWSTGGIAALMAALYRVHLGGPGMWAGLATVLGCTITGRIFRRAFGDRPERLGILSFYGLGISAHIVMLVCQLLVQPWPTGIAVISRIWMPVMMVFPVATVLMGVLLGNEESRIVAERSLRDLTTELEQRVGQRTAELEGANEVLEAFAYSVSHDLREPLRAISGFAEIIARRHRDSLNEEARHYFDNILEASSRMDELITNLLAYSRLGKEVSPLKTIALSPLVAEILSESGSGQIARDAEIVVQPDLPVVTGNRTLLRQILSNLIENALKYRRGGVSHRVEIGAAMEGSRVVVRVSDNGIGIATEHHDRIFNIFQRLHSPDDSAGTGIGLAIVKKAVELMGGTVGVESRPGEGSVFWVKLPAGVIAGNEGGHDEKKSRYFAR